MGILDQEAEVDDAFHKATPGVRRPLSHDANEEWIEKYERYNHVLRSAGESDRLVETKWEEWEETIARLTLDEVAYIISRCIAPPAHRFRPF